MSDSYAEVILPIPVRGRFTYRIPEEIGQAVALFMRVIVPVGKNKQSTGLVTAIHTQHTEGIFVKEITSVPDDQPFIRPVNFDLWQWISRYYICAEGDVLKAAFPSGRLPAKSKRKPKKIPANSALQTGDGSEQDHLKGIVDPVPVGLSAAQKKAAGLIVSQFQQKKVVLLHGVSGCGKTLVYLQCIQDIAGQGKQILLLVPETFHVPQVWDHLAGLPGKQVLMYHSGMNDKERAKTWEQVYRFGEEVPAHPQIILGTRSSIFLPFSKLGLVIVDDEHHDSFKQSDPSPRYQARDMAVLLGSQHNCPVILGSATPSFESLHNASTGKYGLVHLSERFGPTRLPELILADMSVARKKRQMHNILTPELFRALEATLQSGEQALFIQNRRGYASFLQCSGCGHIPQCPACNVNLTSHLSRNQLICHYCGYKTPLMQICPRCGSPEMKSRGSGTEKAESDISALFPQARISRLDKDTASTSRRRSGIIASMENKETDILVGTQMAVNGLETKNIGVAAILNADLMLNMADFRSWEKSYHLFQQLVSLLIRAEPPGKVIFQTTQPELPFYQYLFDQNYQGFYEDFSEERRLFKYPPWHRLTKITLKHRNNGILEQASAIMASQLRSYPHFQVLGPEAPASGKQRGLFIREIWIKSPRNHQAVALQDLLPELIAQLKKIPGNSGISISPDVDPG